MLHTTIYLPLHKLGSSRDTLQIYISSGDGGGGGGATTTAGRALASTIASPGGLDCFAQPQQLSTLPKRGQKVVFAGQNTKSLSCRHRRARVNEAWFNGVVISIGWSACNSSLST